MCHQDGESIPMGMAIKALKEALGLRFPREELQPDTPLFGAYGSILQNEIDLFTLLEVVGKMLEITVDDAVFDQWSSGTMITIKDLANYITKHAKSTQ